MMMKRLSPLATLLCASLLAGNAWSAAVENAKPKSRLAAKIKPETAIAPLPADEPALNEEQMAVGPRVHAGEVACEFNQKVQLTPHPDKPGRFRLQFGKMVYNMTPEPTSTGAVRLEDKAAGVVWLQIPTKSMLMNAKLGQRMVDSCQHADQVSFAKNLSAAKPEGGIGITPGTSINN
ncbi:hypothetical protein RQP53_06250 [Paucibacter sp. APW11]|uniref:Uncharacterized protein n=1 Tax=Roseateles aquae TaxID=3077235 RepID=A0ABU3P9G9_9BURK|nr:hypothetical protein [Paucibacter sp. APW11]MDT8998865.1 hypothetical protein [Paucibacter sp. APW11]